MKTFLFASKSDPKRPPYVAIDDEHGKIECGCPGFIRHKRCWHTDEIKAGRDAIRRMTASEKATILLALEIGDGSHAIFKARELYPSMTYKEAKELVNLVQAMFLAEGEGWL